MKVKKKSEQIVKPNWRRWNRSIECEKKKRTTNKKYTRLLPSPPHLIRKQYNIHILTIPTRTVCAVQNAIISSYMLSLARSVSSFQHFNVLSNSGLSFAIFYCFCFSFFPAHSRSIVFFCCSFGILYFFIYKNPSLLLPPRTTFMFRLLYVLCVRFASFHSVCDSNILFCFVVSSLSIAFVGIAKEWNENVLDFSTFLWVVWWFSCFWHRVFHINIFFFSFYFAFTCRYSRR